MYTRQMTNLEIARQRLYNQRLSTTNYTKPEEVVRWLGAVQAQEYAHAKWGLGLRLRGAQDAEIEQALTDGKILRTHLMRPTWHFVTAEDIRWMLALTAPRVNAVNGTMYRQLELDDAVFARSSDVIIRALEGGRQLTRLELGKELTKAGIEHVSGMRLGYIVHRAELDGIVCSGARRGKQFTYTLINERAPHALSLSRDEALATLVLRYFCSHAPATIQDFARWSGLTQADTKEGLEMVKDRIFQDRIDGKEYWRPADLLPISVEPPAALLLPPYDEMTIGYKDNSAILKEEYSTQAVNAVYGGAAFIHNEILGYWKRTIVKGKVIIETNPFRPWTDDERQLFASAAQPFGEFLGAPVEMIGE